MEQLKELQNKRLTLAARIRELGDREPSWTAEDRANWDTLNGDYDANMALIDAENKRQKDSQAIRNRLEAIQNDLRGGSGNPRFGRDGGDIHETVGNDGASLRAVALQGWMLNASPACRSRVTDAHHQAAAALGIRLDDQQFVINLGDSRDFHAFRSSHVNRPRNDMSGQRMDTGGTLVGQSMSGALEAAMLDYSGVLQVADVIRTTTGEPFTWPTINDTGNVAGLVGEIGDGGTAANPSTGRVIWHAFDFNSGVLGVPRSLLNDSPFNLEMIIGGLLGERIGRKQNKVYTYGTGGGIEPLGIVTASTLGVTAALSNAILYDELIDLEHSIDPSRRNSPGFGYMFHDNMLKAFRKLKTGDGAYLWQSGANSGTPDQINARPFWINQDMDSTMGSGKKTVLCGVLPQYKVRQVGQIVFQRLVERLAATNEDGFIAYARGDGNLLDAGDHPVRYLTHP